MQRAGLVVPTNNTRTDGSSRRFATTRRKSTNIDACSQLGCRMSDQREASGNCDGQAVERVQLSSRGRETYSRPRRSRFAI
jgi:hypothetical protein